MARKEMHQMNVVTSPWKYWNTTTSFHEQDDGEQSSNDVTSSRRHTAWQNFGRQDCDSRDPELYSFEDYVTPINSPGPSDCKYPDVTHQSSHFQSHRVGLSDCRDEDDSGHSGVAMQTKAGDQLSAVQGRTPRSTERSLESLSFNHKMTYFFSNYEVDESPSIRCSYQDICRHRTLQDNPIAIPSTTCLGSLTLPDATDHETDAEPTTPLYYTTPPLSQIPRRCAIKHKRKLIRANTLSSNSILKNTTATEKDVSSVTTVDYTPNEISDDLTTELAGRSWSNPMGIHGSLSLPNRLNEESGGLATTLFQSDLEEEPPDRPTNVALSVVSQKSLLVSFCPPNGQTAADITGYCVEWSRFSGFSPLSGCHTVTDASETSYEIPDLEAGLVYYVQVRAINARGQGPASLANPSYAVPSDWKDIDCVSNRTSGKRQVLDDLYSTIRNTLNDPLRTGSQLLKASPAWKKKVRNTFRNLFTSAPKFHRSTKSSGIYLAVVIHHEGRILVTTNDEAVPVIEIDSNYMPTTATLNADLQWMTKITCNWYNVKMLRQLLHKIALCDVSASQFRRNLLQAVLQLQTAFGVKDLGQLYHQTTHDPTSGAVVLTTVCCLNDSKLVNTAHVKWMSLSKLLKRSPDENFDPNPMNSSVEEIPPQSLNSMLLKASSKMIDYYAGGCVRLVTGLYLGYLKLGCSLDQILVMVDQYQPNTLPNVRVRHNSHVSREEWSFIRESAERNSQTTRMTEAQETFGRQLTKACSRLLKKLGMEESEAREHRLYNFEVLEFGPDVSMIVVLPPTDQICTGPGQKDETLSTCVLIPIYTFEMLHMRMYHTDLMRRYSQLSSFVEIESRIAQQELRMGISEDDMRLAQSRVDVLTDLQQRLEDSWRDMRWIVDMATRARDKKVNCGVSIECLFPSFLTD